MCVAASLLGGCIPLPAALPPARGTLGLGGAAGNPAPADDGTPLSDITPMAVGRIGVTPVSIFEGQERRLIDVEAGYTFQIFTDELRQNRNRHGFYAGGTMTLTTFPVGGLVGRIAVGGYGSYLVMQDHPGDGVGGSGVVGFEVVSPMHQVEDDPHGISFYGLAAGEWGIGVVAYGGGYSVGGYPYATFGAGISVRWPGLLGVGLIPLTGSF